MTSDGPGGDDASPTVAGNRFSTSSSSTTIGYRSSGGVPSVAGPVSIQHDEDERKDDTDEQAEIDPDELTRCVLDGLNRHGPLVLYTLAEVIDRFHRFSVDRSELKEALDLLIEDGRVVVKNGFIHQIDVLDPCSCRENPQGESDENGVADDG